VGTAHRDYHGGQCPPYLDFTMSLSIQQVKKVASLARLELSEAALVKAAEQLNNILKYVDQLSEVNTENIEPMAHPLPIQNIFRDDVPVPCLSVDAALQNAPLRLANFFGVPAVFDSDEPVSH
jgi:aspartyl-tRNA(Asn)/glutamyl-tRNA(Gln) amidotransferase subunit C